MKNDLCGLHDLPELIQSAEETVLPAVEKNTLCIPNQLRFQHHYPTAEQPYPA